MGLHWLRGDLDAGFFVVFEAILHEIPFLPPECTVSKIDRSCFCFGDRCLLNFFMIFFPFEAIFHEITSFHHQMALIYSI